MERGLYLELSSGGPCTGWLGEVQVNSRDKTIAVERIFPSPPLRSETEEVAWATEHVCGWDVVYIDALWPLTLCTRLQQEYPLIKIYILNKTREGYQCYKIQNDYRERKRLKRIKDAA